MMRLIRRLLIGRPLHNRELAHERMPKWKALAIFSSDALSSVGYGPEQAVLILAASGLIVYGYFRDVLAAVIVLLAIVTLSYAQVAKANAGSGGGSYAVAKNYLGEYPGLIVAAALFADYVLTVAVSISSGTDALVSAFPVLAHWNVTVDVVVLFGILMLVNLRGLRESSNTFVLPTYMFVFGIFALIGIGVYHALTGSEPAVPKASLVQAEMNLTVFVLLLRSFANGCSSMTGVEAISNGVPMFKEPQTKNAVYTTYLMSGMLAVMLAGLSFLIMHYHVLPIENVTMLSQVAELTIGRGWFYYYIQLTTMLILYLAANTAFNGLPPLLSLLARDGYLPRYLSALGDRLSYSNGIILLSLVAGLLIVQFEGSVEQLISLYALGVFLSFTLAQAGMVLHWYHDKGKGWMYRAALNGTGAIVTGVVVLVVAITKFMYGVWIILIFIPAMVYMFKRIHRHYEDMAKQLHLPEESYAEGATFFPQGKHIIIVPVSTPTRVVYDTIKYAKMIGDHIIAVNVSDNAEAEKKLREKWQRWNPGVELTVLHSPFRFLMRPLIQFIEKKAREKGPDDYITVIIPEFETNKLWHRILHGQTGWLLRSALIGRRSNIIVTTVPYHLKE